MRKIVLKIHLWLGLLSGLVVFIVALTGCIYVFKEEIQNSTETFRYVTPQNKTYLNPSILIQKAQKILPDKKIHALMYHREGKATKVIFYEYEKKDYFFIYMNPYSGKILKVVDINQDFFTFILNGHFYLWLPDSIGQTIVASSTFIFLILLISGLILWWPKKKNQRKTAFQFKWKNTRWKRRNYDLHRILGFYVFSFGLVFAITGLVWGFVWFRDTYYYTITGGKSYQEYVEPISQLVEKNSKNEQNSLLQLDKIWNKVKQELPKNGWIELHIPEAKEGSIAININPDEETYWKTDYRYFDQYSLNELNVTHQWGRFNDKLLNGDKLMRMNYDIHVGGIGGIYGKIIAFFLSLIIASLPITGFLIWWGRRKKSN